MTTLAQRPPMKSPVGGPHMSTQERVTFVVYVVLCTALVTFLLASSAFWLI